MSGSKGVDLLMKFKGEDGRLLEAESTDSLGLDAFYKGDQPDPLLKGFEKGKVFEVFEFGFGAGNRNNSEHPLLQDYKDEVEAAKQRGDKDTAKRFNKKVVKLQNAAIKDWKFGEDENDVEMQPVTFSRLIDKGSSTILTRCFDSARFEAVTLVKRRGVGGKLSGYAYLRMDFGEAVITNVAWSDDDQVKETISLIFRKVLIQYCPVLPNGEIGYPVSGNWEMAGVQPQRMV